MVAAEVSEALRVLREWDNTASRDSRGSSLFELWVDAYLDLAADSLRYDVDWSDDEPMTTPRGVGDEGAAVEAFGLAMARAMVRWGAVDVTWGEVHRGIATSSTAVLSVS